LHILVEPSYPCPPTLINKLRACAHPAVIVSQICTVISKINVLFTHLHALVPRTTVVCTPCSPQKCIYTRVSTPVRRCSNCSASPCKPLRPILQIGLCPRNRQYPRHPMAQSQLRCHTGIIRLSAMVRAPSSLYVVRTRSLATEPVHHWHKSLFPPLFSRFFFTINTLFDKTLSNLNIQTFR